MKKAKIMLTAITVLAVVGGALAFKAKTVGSTFLFTSVNGVCVSSFDGSNETYSPTGTKYVHATISAIQPPATLCTLTTTAIEGD